MAYKQTTNQKFLDDHLVYTQHVGFSIFNIFSTILNKQLQLLFNKCTKPIYTIFTCFCSSVLLYYNYSWHSKFWSERHFHFFKNGNPYSDIKINDWWVWLKLWVDFCFAFQYLKSVQVPSWQRFKCKFYWTLITLHCKPCPIENTLMPIHTQQQPRDCIDATANIKSYRLQWMSLEQTYAVHYFNMMLTPPAFRSSVACVHTK